MKPHWTGVLTTWPWLMQQHFGVRLVLYKYTTSSLWCKNNSLNACDWESIYYLSVAHQVEPASPTFGGGEQGASKARDDPVLGHCCFLARQHLGVVATLEPAGVSAVNVTKGRTILYSTCQILATHCTQYPCALDLYVYKACCPRGQYFDFACLPNVQFYSFTYFILPHVWSCSVFIANIVQLLVNIGSCHSKV